MTIVEVANSDDASSLPFHHARIASSDDASSLPFHHARIASFIKHSPMV